MPALLWDFEAHGGADVAAAMREVAEEAGDPELMEDFARFIDDVGSVIKEELDGATSEALASAMYKSRTGTLDASTYADEPEVSADGVVVTWGARAPYASFVERRGFSRTGDIADEAERRIDDRLAEL